MVELGPVHSISAAVAGHPKALAGKGLEPHAENAIHLSRLTRFLRGDGISPHPHPHTVGIALIDIWRLDAGIHEQGLVGDLGKLVALRRPAGDRQTAGDLRIVLRNVLNDELVRLRGRALPVREHRPSQLSQVVPSGLKLIAQRANRVTPIVVSVEGSLYSLVNIYGRRRAIAGLPGD